MKKMFLLIVMLTPMLALAQTAAVAPPAPVKAEVKNTKDAPEPPAEKAVPANGASAPADILTRPTPPPGADVSRELQESLVNLQIAQYGYDQVQPWKRTELEEKGAYGCAVGPYEVLTTAYHLTDATYIKARRFGQNEFIPATVKVVDYESNLALLELDQKVMGPPLRPIQFGADYRKGAAVDFYWLPAQGDVYSGRGFIDRSQVTQSVLSYAKFVNFIISNTSKNIGLGELFLLDGQPIGLGCWFRKNTTEAGIIPGVVINHFLADARGGAYKGFPTLGFKAEELLDPTRRAFLKLDVALKDGVYVSDVYTLGTGKDVLKPQDVIVAINGTRLNAYGRYLDGKLGWTSFEHLVAGGQIGEKIKFELYRGGQKCTLEAPAENFPAEKMLVPWYEYGQQPAYAVVGGFVLQRLTRQYLAHWGENWEKAVSPQLYHIFQEKAFKPNPEDRDVVILSFVFPFETNLGYHDLRQEVVKSYNGRPVHSMADIVEAQKESKDNKFDTIELEYDNPTIVLPRALLPAANTAIAKNYGITQLQNID